MTSRLSTPTALRIATTLLLGLLAGTLYAGGAPTLEPGTLLGSTAADGNQLVQIDPMSGIGAPLSVFDTGASVTEIRFREDGVLFGSTGGGQSSLFTIDPLTGVSTLVGVHPFGAINGLEFVDGTLYGSFFAAGGSRGDGPPPVTLVIVDQTDATLTPVGLMSGFFPVRGLAYDASVGTLFAAGVPVGSPEGVSDSLLSIDLGSGTPTEIGPLGVDIGGLDFGPDGLLYGGTTSGELVVIDTTDASVSSVGPTGFAALSGLAFVPGGAPPVIEVPTTSGLGLLLLTLVLAATALLFSRRRHRLGA